LANSKLMQTEYEANLVWSSCEPVQPSTCGWWTQTQIHCDTNFL